MLPEIDPFLPAMLVGEQPPDGGCGPFGALDGDSGRRLAALAGLEPEVLYASTERHNLLNHAGEWLRHDEAAVDAAWALAQRSAGRRVLMLGARVAEAFARAMSLQLAGSTLPRFSALRVDGLELVCLPHPSGQNRELNDEVVAQATGRIVRAEVDRYRKARGSWCAIRVRSDYVDSEDLIYHPTTGHFAGGKDDADRPFAADDACAFDPQFGGLDHAQQAALLDYLVGAAGRVCRWGAGVPCYVGPHSVDVAGRAAQLATAMGWDENAIRLAVGAAALHDLHECLPAVGDVPGPLVRALQATSPAWRRVEEVARRAITDHYASPFLPDDLGWSARLAELVHTADLDCRATERALFFGDAPAWLGARGQALAELVLRARRAGPLRGVLPEHLYRYDPDDLRKAIKGETPAWTPSADLLPIV